MSKLHFILIPIILLLLYSCDGNNNKVNISGTNFQDEVPLQFNFEFQFDKPVASDTLINRRIDADLLVFDPPIKGSFSWTRDDLLMFSPSEKLTPATKYSVKVGDSYKKFGGGVPIDDQWTAKFHTPLLTVQDVNGYWGADKNNAKVPGMYVSINFNHKISPNDLAGKLKVMVDNESQSFVVEQENTSEEITLYLPQVKAADKNFVINLNFSKDLKPVVGEVSLNEDLEITKNLTSPFIMEVKGLKGEYNGVEGIIKVFTSQKVDEEDFKKNFTMEPSVNYSLEFSDQEVQIISGEYDTDRTYTIMLDKGMKGVFGGQLKSEYEGVASFGEISPSIKFLDEKNIYLSKNGNRNIEVNIVNVDNVTMTVRKVYENNIIQFFNNRGYYDYYYDDYYDDYGGYSGDNNQVGQMGDVVWEEKIETKNLSSKGANKLLNFNIKDKIPNLDGVYQITLNSNNDYWVTSSKIMTVSDIGLIVKKGAKSISVFANSIDKATPLSGVDITLIGNNNQSTKSGKTDVNGVLVLEIDELAGLNFETGLITARLGEDYNFMLLQKTQISTSRYDIGGHREDPSGLMTYVYPERDIYRPGEKVNVSTIIRDYQWNAPKTFPIKIKLTSPNGKEVGNVRKTLNKEGGADVSFQLTPGSPTGSYLVTILTATDVVLQNQYIKVEEFVPDRIKVNSNFDKEVYNNGDEIALDIEALNLFGTPASNRNWESELQISRSYFSVPDFGNYNFSINQNYTYFNNIMETGSTDGEGKANVNFQIPEEYANMGMLYARAFTTVFDETGRPVNRNNSASIHTQDYYYGMEYGNYYNRTNEPVVTKIVAVGQDKKVANGVEAELTLIRHEYKSVLSQSGRYYRYQSVPREVILEQKTITLNGNDNSYSFIPDFSGRYELRISKPGVSNHVSQTFYCYGWGSTNNSSFKVDNEGNIDIKVDKENYSVGETVKVLMTTPFSGKVLVTVESNKVLKHFYRDTDKKSLSFDLKITEDMLPNVYVSATLFRPHAVSDLPLTVAHGYAPVIVKDEKREIPITIDAVEKSRSKMKQKIVLKGAPNSMMTVAVVDEGILQVTGFVTPDPFDYFYQKRALGLTSYNMYPYLFPEVSLHSGKPGGGDGGEMEKRLNPMKNKRFNLVSYWSGILETDNNGKASYEIDIPQFSGSLRIMAVNYKGNTFGAEDKNMIIADPIILSAGIPRFLSPGDTLVMPLTITNTTDKATDARSVIELEGPLTLVKDGNDEIEIKANSEGRKVYRIAVAKEIGQAKITAKVTAMGETFTHETNITVRPGSPLQKRSGAGTVEANKTETVSFDEDGFMPKTIERKLLVSNSPLVKFTRDIEYLVGYPHGCVEQTVSKAFPQLYFEDIIKDMGIYSKNAKSARYNVDQAIAKLQQMQLYNGAFTYWPGHGYESYWGSVLATHFLLEAKNAGYQVHEGLLNTALDNLKMKMKDKKRVDYYYNGNQRRTIIPREALYSSYVLALANKADRSMMNYYKSNVKDLSMDSKYLLAGAYQLIGDQKSFDEILPNSFEGERSNQELGGSFSSYVRDEALALNILLETDPENSQIAYMAKHVAEQLSNSRYLNTQERLFGFLAMGKIARNNAGNDVTASIKSGGKTLREFKGNTLKLEGDKLASANIDITTSGKGELYYFWETEGIDARGDYKEEDSFMRVRKTFYTRSGQEIKNNKFKQNDLIVVKVSIAGITSKTIENVAISDILPAGFEIENPRLDDLPQYQWMKNKSYPDYQDIRDDRINMYLNVNSYTRNFYYMVRAVSPGTYYMGPIGADAMYNGEYHSYHGAAWIEISE